MVERLTAIKCAIGDLLGGKYLVKEGAAPNHVVTPRGEISRANVIAAVVDKASVTSLLLDDGSGKLECRSFDNEQLFANVLVGDVILVIGRPREYQGKRYLVAEIAKRLGSPRWLEFRTVELGSVARPREEAPEKSARPAVEVKAKRAVKSAEPDVPVVNQTDAMLALIRQLDAGSGAAIEEVVERSGNAAAESILTSLMAEGEIFEIKPGRVKVLE